MCQEDFAILTLAESYLEERNHSSDAKSKPRSPWLEWRLRNLVRTTLGHVLVSTDLVW